MKRTKAEARKMIQAHNAIVGATINVVLDMQPVVFASREELTKVCEWAGVSIKFENETLHAFAFETRS
jgi:hypothetical protein|tara:strand:- start:26 stop:229 length:204 start_codon:yes stop_codon:yes gene_type:complete